MSLDNAAIEAAVPAAVATRPCDDCGAEDVFDAMTDRDLLLYIARAMAQTVHIAEQVQGQVQPVVDKLAGNPLLSGLFGGFGKRG